MKSAARKARRERHQLRRATHTVASARGTSLQIPARRIDLPSQAWLSDKAKSRIVFASIALTAGAFAVTDTTMAMPFRVMCALVAVAGLVLGILAEGRRDPATQPAPARHGKAPAVAAPIRWALLCALLLAELALPHPAAAAFWTFIFANVMTNTERVRNFVLGGVVALTSFMAMGLVAIAIVMSVRGTSGIPIGDGEQILMIACIVLALLLPGMSRRIAKRYVWDAPAQRSGQ